MSYLSLDIGKKRIGVAFGSLIAQELTTLHVQEPAKSFLDDGPGTDQAKKQILQLIIENHAEKLIIGHPLNDDGSESEIAQKISHFAKELEKTVDLPIELVDETLTSFVAEEMLKEEGVSIKDAKLRVDQVAAKLILQQYIEEE